MQESRLAFASRPARARNMRASLAAFAGSASEDSPCFARKYILKLVGYGTQLKEALNMSSCGRHCSQLAR